MISFRLFKNKYKEEGDNKPSYKTPTISYKKDQDTGVETKTFQQDVIFRKGEMYQASLFKNSDGSLGVKIELNTYDQDKKNTNNTNNAKIEGIDDIPF
tara:strand:+ start:19 stop:312 length:294 start_codon:yes stop_codon:yes gene_type:complete